jgi:hypothetical protein
VLRELQALFDLADAEVAAIKVSGRNGLLPAFRDETLLRVTYACRLRRNAVRLLGVTDLGRNPKHPRSAAHAVVGVRHGNAIRGSPRIAGHRYDDVAEPTNAR